MRHAVIWGRRRQGKSTLALALAIASGKRPIIIFDACDQYTLFPVADDDLLEELLDSEYGVVRWSPAGDDPENAFENLMAILDGGTWRWAEYALIVDESSILQRPQRIHPALDRLVRQAPDDIFVVQTMHRPSDAHPLVRSLASDYFWFQTYLARDLGVVADTWGTEVAERISQLPSYHVLHFWLDLGGKPRWTIWSDPAIWYVPLRYSDVERAGQDSERDREPEPAA